MLPLHYIYLPSNFLNNVLCLKSPLKSPKNILDHMESLHMIAPMILFLGIQWLLLNLFFFPIHSVHYQQEREHYEYVVVEGKVLHQQTGELLDTTKGSPGAKWIFVMSTSKKLYAGEVRTEKFFFHDEYRILKLFLWIILILWNDYVHNVVRKRRECFIIPVSLLAGLL